MGWAAAGCGGFKDAHPETRGQQWQVAVSKERANIRTKAPRNPIPTPRTRASTSAAVAKASSGGGGSGKGSESGRGQQSGGSQQHSGSQGSGGGDDLKAREYKDEQGNVHHHTRTYQEQHKGENNK